MERKIKKIHFADNLAIIFSIIAVWGTIMMILFNVISLSKSILFTIIAIAAAFSVLIAVSITSLALILHLKINRNELYSEEILQMRKSRENTGV
jgi:hypothetical protein